jgi:beta-lactamase regulating signal transducer with metallopeptidase domain
VTDILLVLLKVNFAAAVAVAIVMTARKKVRETMGPDAAYLMWAIVPVAMLAVLIPSRIVMVEHGGTGQVSNFWGEALWPFAAVLVLAWMTGVILMAGELLKRQQLFMEDVGFRKAGPAVVGFFYPYVVTPADFSRRFSEEERKLIMAHEQVHLERQDIRINAVVAAVRCLCWFNPLIHMGAHYLRADQELSCDAAVIERRPKARRAYAETLLKTQLADRSLPVGCYWPPAGNWGTSHPLMERIAMLTRTPFSGRRRVAAAAAVLTLVSGGGFAAWAAQPPREVVAAPAGDEAQNEGSQLFIARAGKTEIFVILEPDDVIEVRPPSAKPTP